MNGAPVLSAAKRSRREPVERLERLERASVLFERPEPDFKTGHSKIQDLTLEATLPNTVNEAEKTNLRDRLGSRAPGLSDLSGAPTS